MHSNDSSGLWENLNIWSFLWLHLTFLSKSRSSRWSFYQGQADACQITFTLFLSFLILQLSGLWKKFQIVCTAVTSNCSYKNFHKSIQYIGMFIFPVWEGNGTYSPHLMGFSTGTESQWKTCWNKSGWVEKIIRNKIWWDLIINKTWWALAQAKNYNGMWKKSFWKADQS